MWRRTRTMSRVRPPYATSHSGGMSPQWANRGDSRGRLEPPRRGVQRARPSGPTRESRGAVSPLLWRGFHLLPRFSGRLTAVSGQGRRQPGSRSNLAGPRARTRQDYSRFSMGAFPSRLVRTVVADRCSRKTLNMIRTRVSPPGNLRVSPLRLVVCSSGPFSPGSGWPRKIDVGRLVNVVLRRWARGPHERANRVGVRETPNPPPPGPFNDLGRLR
jgi:hypothetical protein